MDVQASVSVHVVPSHSLNVLHSKRPRCPFVLVYKTGSQILQILRILPGMRDANSIIRSIRSLKYVSNKMNLKQKIYKITSVEPFVY